MRASKPTLGIAFPKCDYVCNEGLGKKEGIFDVPFDDDDKKINKWN